MRNVFAGILLAMSLPAMADLAADIQTMGAAAALKSAKEECGTNCDDAELVNVMLQSGVPAQVVAQLAKANGISPATVAQSIASTGVPASIAVQIVLNENPEARSNPQLVAQITNAAVNAPQQAPALGGVGDGVGDGVGGVGDVGGVGGDAFGQDADYSIFRSSLLDVPQPWVPQPTPQGVGSPI